MGEVTWGELTGNKTEAVREQVKRQKAFCRKNSDSGGNNPADWKVRKRHRRGAYLWLTSLHNQIQSWLHHGLYHFKVGEDAPEDPSLWPRLRVAPDMGSDGVQWCINISMKFKQVGVVI